MRQGRVAITLIAFAALSTIGRAQRPASVSDLLDQFEKEPKFWKQFDVAKQIVEAKDASVLSRLEPWLKHENQQLRGNAAFIFAGLGDPRGFDVIVSMLLDRSGKPKDRSATSKRAIVQAQQLEDRYRETRYYAAHLLGDLKDRRAVPILLPLLGDPEVNSIIPWSLAQIGDPSAIPPLIRALSDSNPSVRVLAIHALQNLKATEALPTLRQLLNDNEIGKSESVAEAARYAIARLQPENR